MHKAEKNILVVDDDRNFTLSLRDHLQADGLQVRIAHTGAECIAACAREQVDIVLLDQQLPDAEGADLCPAILERNGQAKIIFTTAFPSFDNAVRAVRAGAFDYLSKPFELEELDLAIRQALRTLDLEKVEQFQKYRSKKEGEKSILVGDSAQISEVRRLIGLAAESDAPVLITGETGSGKNVAALSVHYRGPLRSAPFISINCAALPESLIEAELFGHEKGAFTGAVGMKKGLFEMAENGTLFLDEIGEMPIALQAKLLGVLDDHSFRRIGGTSQLHANVRILAATSVDLDKAIQRKKFREDLYYRLGVIKIQLPPLRMRKDDLPALCEHLIRTVGHGQGRLAAGELEALAAYEWPGNVRELKNVLERAVILQRGGELRPSEFLSVLAKNAARALPRYEPAGEHKPAVTLDEVEKSHILSTLKEQQGNFSRTARAMGISLTTLKRKLRKYQGGT